MTADPLAPLRARFRERALADARAMEAALARPGGMAEVENIAHGLAGMAGMFGHGELGVAALAVDRMFDGGGTPSVAAVRALVEAIDRELGGPHS